MSDLIVIGYDNPQTARQAYEQVQRLQQDFVVELRGLAIVDVDADGKTHVDTPQRIIGTSAAHGALFGLLLGLLFFVPGMVLLGGAIGALMGTFTKSGIDAEFRNRVEHLVEPGHSALVIMASKITEDKFLSRAEFSIDWVRTRPRSTLGSAAGCRAAVLQSDQHDLGACSELVGAITERGGPGQRRVDV